MKAYEGSFNFRRGDGRPIYDPPELQALTDKFPVTVDGVEVKQCWYADAAAGIAKTYDVLRDGTPHTVRRDFPEFWSKEDFPGRDVDCPLDGVLSETLRGKVEIWGQD